MSWRRKEPGECFTNISRKILSKIVYCRNWNFCEIFKLKICTYARSHALASRTKFQLGILIINVISGIVYFRQIMLESSQNVGETTPEH